MWSKGFVAEETRAAFARARELTAGADNSAERFVIYYAQWLGSVGRGEWALARETAETFRREADNEGRATERVVGSRILGLTCLIQGDLSEAQAHLRQALNAHDPARHGDAKSRFGQDVAACASTYLAFTDWLLGDVGNTRARMEQAIARAVETNHVMTQANTYLHMAFFEIVRGDCDAARRAAQAVVELAEEHGLAQYTMWGALSNAYLRAPFGDRSPGLRKLVRRWRHIAVKDTRTPCRFTKVCSQNLRPRGRALKQPWRGSTRRWHWRVGRENTGVTLSCIASAARFY